MLRNLFPKHCLDTVHDIPYEMLHDNGIDGVIFDIDNTLVPHGAPADESAIKLFERLREIGLSTCLLSNNKEQRVAEFAKQVKSDYIYKAGKPSVKSYFKAMEKMRTKRENTIFAGDQIFTDIWGANRVGIYNFMVKPINPKEEIQIRLKRIPEKVILFLYELFKM